jgi:hypothetical protein
MKLTTTRKRREIRLKRPLYQEYLKKTYIIYKYQGNQITAKQETDFMYSKWQAQKYQG